MSNLSFLSKLVERIVAVRFVDHLSENGLYELFQSAYRHLHSTETALLRVQNDILRAVDSSGGAILVLLDLSAAFDTIDHEKLLQILESSFGITGQALEWFRSYLTDRTQRVVIDGQYSNTSKLLFGVPQGSVLGPILFTVYTTSLGHIIRKHGLSFHLYADDTQLYIAVKPTDNSSISDTIVKIQICVSDIKRWMTKNLLKLNDDKTELLIITTKHLSSQVSSRTIQLCDHAISSSPAVRNLGVMFDATCSMDQHVTNICKAAHWQIYRIGQIRKFLDIPTTKTLVNSLVTSRLDYCNSLLSRISQQNMQRLQRIQNTCARLVMRIPKHDHITEVLRDLHWLPVEKRIEFKVLLLTYKSLHGYAPQYLRDLLTPYEPGRSLRSENTYLLDTPNTRLKTFGDRAFSKYAPELWNALPLIFRTLPSVDSFKKHLKTHLFHSVYKVKVSKCICNSQRL